MKSKTILFSCAFGALSLLGLACSSTIGNVRGVPLSNAAQADDTCEVEIVRDANSLPEEREELGVIMTESHEFASVYDLEALLRNSACEQGVTHLLIVDEIYHDIIRGSWARAVAFKSNAAPAPLAQK